MLMNTYYSNMPKKKKKLSTSYVTIEENDSETFADYLNETDWSNIAPKKELYKHDVKNKKSERSEFVTLDLHGYTLTEAIACVDLNIANFTKSNNLSIKFKIITGKGYHSGTNGPVLPSEVHTHILSKWKDYIEVIDASPIDITINNIPTRGHFFVTLNKNIKL